MRLVRWPALLGLPVTLRAQPQAHSLAVLRPSVVPLVRLLVLLGRSVMSLVRSPAQQVRWVERRVPSLARSRAVRTLSEELPERLPGRRVFSATPLARSAGRCRLVLRLRATPPQHWRAVRARSVTLQVLLAARSAVVLMLSPVLRVRSLVRPARLEGLQVRWEAPLAAAPALWAVWPGRQEAGLKVEPGQLAVPLVRSPVRLVRSEKQRVHSVAPSEPVRMPSVAPRALWQVLQVHWAMPQAHSLVLYKAALTLPVGSLVRQERSVMSPGAWREAPVRSATLQGLAVLHLPVALVLRRRPLVRSRAVRVHWARWLVRLQVARKRSVMWLVPLRALRKQVVRLLARLKLSEAPQVASREPSKAAPMRWVAQRARSLDPRVLSATQRAGSQEHLMVALESSVTRQGRSRGPRAVRQTRSAESPGRWLEAPTRLATRPGRCPGAPSSWAMQQPVWPVPEVLPRKLLEASREPLRVEPRRSVELLVPSQGHLKARLGLRADSPRRLSR